jgi:hypothetical protein
MILLHLVSTSAGACTPVALEPVRTGARGTPSLRLDGFTGTVEITGAFTEWIGVTGTACGIALVESEPVAGELVLIVVGDPTDLTVAVTVPWNLPIEVSDLRGDLHAHRLVELAVRDGEGNVTLGDGWRLGVDGFDGDVSANLLRGDVTVRGLVGALFLQECVGHIVARRVDGRVATAGATGPLTVRRRPRTEIIDFE